VDYAWSGHAGAPTGPRRERQSRRDCRVGDEAEGASGARDASALVQIWATAQTVGADIVVASAASVPTSRLDSDWSAGATEISAAAVTCRSPRASAIPGRATLERAQPATAVIVRVSQFRHRGAQRPARSTASALFALRAAGRLRSPVAGAGVKATCALAERETRFAAKPGASCPGGGRGQTVSVRRGG